MSTTHAAPAHVWQRRTDPWLLVSVLLAATLVGLGAWLLSDRGSSGGATEQATTVLDDFQAAFNAGDQPALAALMAKNVEMRSLGDVGRGRDVLARGFADHVKQVGVQMKRVSPVTVNGEFASFFERYTEPGASGTFLSVFQLRDGKVLRLWGFQPGVTPPFENAASPSDTGARGG